MSGIKVKTPVHFQSGGQSKKEIQEDEALARMPPRLPRVAKLLYRSS